MVYRSILTTRRTRQKINCCLNKLWGVECSRCSRNAFHIQQMLVRCVDVQEMYTLLAAFVYVRRTVGKCEFVPSAQALTTSKLNSWTVEVDVNSLVSETSTEMVAEHGTRKGEKATNHFRLPFAVFFSWLRIFARSIIIIMILLKSLFIFFSPFLSFSFVRFFVFYFPLFVYLWYERTEGRWYGRMVNKRKWKKKMLYLWVSSRKSNPSGLSNIKVKVARISKDKTAVRFIQMRSHKSKSWNFYGTTENIKTLLRRLHGVDTTHEHDNISQSRPESVQKKKMQNRKIVREKYARTRLINFLANQNQLKRCSDFSELINVLPVQIRCRRDPICRYAFIPAAHRDCNRRKTRLDTLTWAQTQYSLIGDTSGDRRRIGTFCSFLSTDHEWRKFKIGWRK